MSITKETLIDQITVVENGEVLYRTVTRIMEDGEELSKTFHRTSIYPGQDLTGRPEKVVAICSTVWTPEVVAAFNQARDEENARLAAKYTLPEPPVQAVEPQPVPTVN